MTDDFRRKSRNRFLRTTLQKTPLDLYPDVLEKRIFLANFSNFTKLNIFSSPEEKEEEVFLTLKTSIFDMKTKKFPVTPTRFSERELHRIKKTEFKLSESSDYSFSVIAPKIQNSNFYLFTEFVISQRKEGSSGVKKKLGWFILPLKSLNCKIEALFFADPKILETQELNQISTVLKKEAGLTVFISELKGESDLFPTLPNFGVQVLSLNSRPASLTTPSELSFHTDFIFTLRVNNFKLYQKPDFDKQLLDVLKKERKSKPKIIRKTLVLTYASRLKRQEFRLVCKQIKNSNMLIVEKDSHVVFNNISKAYNGVLLIRLVYTFSKKNIVRYATTDPADLAVGVAFCTIEELLAFKDKADFEFRSVSPELEGLLNGVAIGLEQMNVEANVFAAKQDQSEKEFRLVENLKSDRLLKKSRLITESAKEDKGEISPSGFMKNDTLISINEEEKAVIDEYDKLNDKNSVDKKNSNNKESDNEDKDSMIRKDDVEKEEKKSGGKTVEFTEIDDVGQEMVINKKEEKSKKTKDELKVVKTNNNSESEICSEFDDFFDDNFDDEPQNSNDVAIKEINNQVEKNKKQQKKIKEYKEDTEKTDQKEETNNKENTKNKEEINNKEKNGDKEKVKNKNEISMGIIPNIVITKPDEITEEKLNNLEAEIQTQREIVQRTEQQIIMREDHFDQISKEVKVSELKLEERKDISRKSGKSLIKSQSYCKNDYNSYKLAEKQRRKNKSIMPSNPNLNNKNTEILNLLKQEIEDLKKSNEEKNKKIEELSEKLKNPEKTEKFRKIFIDMESNNFKNLEPSPEFFVENEGYIYAQELMDISVQQLTFQLHHITFNPDILKSIQNHSTVRLSTTDLSNNKIRSEPVCYHLLPSKHPQEINIRSIADLADKRLDCVSEDRYSTKVNLTFELDPFTKNNCPTTQFLNHKAFVDVLASGKGRIVFEDGYTKDELFYCDVNLSGFFRGGRQTQVVSVDLPIYVREKTTSGVVRKKIGEVNIVLINRQLENSTRLKREFMEETNNFVNLECLLTNKERSKDHLRRKTLVVRKKRKIESTKNKTKGSQENIEDMKNKKKLLQIKKFKENFLNNKNKKIEKEIKEETEEERIKRLKVLVMNSKFHLFREAKAYKGKKLFIPIKFVNTYNSELFCLKITPLSGKEENPSKLKLASDPETINTALSELSQTFKAIPSLLVKIPSEKIVKTEQFICGENETYFLFLSFISFTSQYKEEFSVVFKDKTGAEVYTFKLSVTTEENFNQETFSLYEQDTDKTNFAVDLSQIGIKGDLSHFADLTFVASLDHISVGRVDNKMQFMLSKTSDEDNSFSPAEKHNNTRDISFNIYIYGSSSLNELLMNIHFNIFYIESVDVLLEPGVPKSLQVPIYSEASRRVRIVPKLEKEFKLKEKEIQLIPSLNNILRAEVTSYSPNSEFKGLITLVDTFTKSVYKRLTVNLMVKAVEPQKVIFQKVQNFNENMFNFSFNNKSGKFADFEFFSSDEQFLVVTEKKIGVEKGEEVDINVKLLKTAFVGRKTFYIFAIAFNAYINECYQIDVEFFENY